MKKRFRRLAMVTIVGLMLTSTGILCGQSRERPAQPGVPGGLVYPAQDAQPGRPGVPGGFGSGFAAGAAPVDPATGLPTDVAIPETWQEKVPKDISFKDLPLGEV